MPSASLFSPGLLVLWENIIIIITIHHYHIMLLFSPGLLVLWENKVEEYECRNMYERKCRSVYQGEQKGCASCNFLFTSVEWVLAQHLTSCKHSLFNFLLQKAADFPSIVVLLRDIHPSPQQVMLCFEQTIVESLAESDPADELVFCQYSK